MTIKLTPFTCYSKLGMSRGGQKEGDRIHPEVMWTLFMCVEFEGMVEQATGSVLKAFKSRAWVRAF